MGCSTSIQFDILSTLPDFFESPLRVGVIGRAVVSGRIGVRIHDLRDFTTDRHRKIDDVPYGGGGGMVIKPEPVFRAVEAIRGADPEQEIRTILLSPQGRRLDHETAARLAGCSRLLLICGRYEGFDERVRERCVDQEISIGDYVLSGGEAAAVVLIEAIGRLVPGVLGNEESPRRDSFRNGLLDAPRYTRPARYRDLEVPEVLRSGHHDRIDGWKQEQARANTARKRPDLLGERRAAGRMPPITGRGGDS